MKNITRITKERPQLHYKAQPFRGTESRKNKWQDTSVQLQNKTVREEQTTREFY